MTGQNEQQWLAALQQDCQRIYNQVNSVVPQGYIMMSPGQITAAIRFIDNGINYLRDTYGATANSLSESGSPSLFLQLQRAFHDFQNGKNIYESMINSQPAPPNPNPGFPPRFPGPDDIQRWLDEQSRRNARFTNILTGRCVWCSQDREGKDPCPHCGRYQNG